MAIYDGYDYGETSGFASHSCKKEHDILHTEIHENTEHDNKQEEAILENKKINDEQQIDIETLYAKLAEEAKSRAEYDEFLKQMIEAETARALAAEKAENERALAAEKTENERALAAEKTENERALTAEADLQTQLDAEIARAKDVEEKIRMHHRDDIDKVNTALNAINASINNLNAAIQNLQSAFNSHFVTHTVYTTGISSRNDEGVALDIDLINGQLSSLADEITDLNSDISSLQKENSSLKDLINNINKD